MSDVSVVIDNLVLTGDVAEPDGGERLAELTESALRRLFERESVPHGLLGGHTAEVLTADANLAAGSGIEERAEGLAAALFRALRSAR